ncbi:hypothetical protein Tco_0145213 [Tanacetum coccineum]
MLLEQQQENSQHWCNCGSNTGKRQTVYLLQFKGRVILPYSALNPKSERDETIVITPPRLLIQPISWMPMTRDCDDSISQECSHGNLSRNGSEHSTEKVSAGVKTKAVLKGITILKMVTIVVPDSDETIELE